MDLLDFAAQDRLKKTAPLAQRMRPGNLDQFVGQEHILGPGRLLRRAILADQLTSLIFYGPPGTGKTTLAQVIANQSRSQFLAINAVLAGVKDIRAAITQAEEQLKQQGQRTILFIDEVHRFNKAQQDALLPHVERGLIVLVGATTENPYFEVNKALLSRSRVFELHSLQPADLETILQLALEDKERGFGDRSVSVAPNALAHLADVASGDARAALNALELAVVSSEPNQAGVVIVDLAVAEESIQRRAVLYDKDGDAHFDIASAFIKSIRGSDPDAALYWMARMLYGGEDPKFLFRRMIISASEDIGLADPRALEQVMAAAKAYEQVGLPEGRFHLSQACLYLATAPKSNSTFAFFGALKAVEKEQVASVPTHLKDPSRDKIELGHGKDYLYPHAYQDHWVKQQYLPKELQGRLFYQPQNLGFESQIKVEVERNREALLAAMPEQEGQAAWQERTLSSEASALGEMRDRLIKLAGPLGEFPLVLCLGRYAELLGLELARSAPQATLYLQGETEAQAKRLQARFPKGVFKAPVIKTGSLATIMAELNAEALQFDLVIGAELDFSKVANLSSCMVQHGVLVLANRQAQSGQKLTDLLDPVFLATSPGQLIQTSEAEFFADPTNPLHSKSVEAVVKQLAGQRFEVSEPKIDELHFTLELSHRQIERWCDRSLSFGYASYLPLKPDGLEVILKEQLTRRRTQGPVNWKNVWGFIAAKLE